MIRDATEADRDRVRWLFEQMHGELLPMGGTVRPGARASAWVNDCFSVALEGEGACLVEDRDEEIVGVSLAIEMTFPYDLTLGDRMACGLGTYVDVAYRKCGVADGLYKAMKERLRGLGFGAYMGGYLTENRAIQGLLQRNGAIEIERAIYFPLGGTAS